MKRGVFLRTEILHYKRRVTSCKYVPREGLFSLIVYLSRFGATRTGFARARPRKKAGTRGQRQAGKGGVGGAFPARPFGKAPAT